MATQAWLNGSKASRRAAKPTNYVVTNANACPRNEHNYDITGLVGGAAINNLKPSVKLLGSAMEKQKRNQNNYIRGQQENKM